MDGALNDFYKLLYKCFVFYFLTIYDSYREITATATTELRCNVLLSNRVWALESFLRNSAFIDLTFKIFYKCVNCLS